MARKGLIITATGRALRCFACSSPVGRSHGQGRAGRGAVHKGTVEYRSPARARICRESPLGGALRSARSASPRPIRRGADERSSGDGPGRSPAERRSARGTRGESPKAGQRSPGIHPPGCSKPAPGIVTRQGGDARPRATMPRPAGGGSAGDAAGSEAPRGGRRGRETGAARLREAKPTRARCHAGTAGQGPRRRPVPRASCFGIAKSASIGT